MPHGHLSEWEIFSLWRWGRSGQCPDLSLKIVDRQMKETGVTRTCPKSKAKGNGYLWKS